MISPDPMEQRKNSLLSRTNIIFQMQNRSAGALKCRYARVEHWYNLKVSNEDMFSYGPFIKRTVFYLRPDYGLHVVGRILQAI